MTQTAEYRPVMNSRPMREEFDLSYRPVPATAPVALFLGVCSALCLVSVLAFVFCLVGLGVGAAAMLKIRGSRGEYGGKWLATSGTVLSVLFLFGGVGWHSYLFATEVPEGFERVTFRSDISEKGFVNQNGQVGPHPDVAALDGQKVFLKGYMYPEEKQEGIRSFILVKDSGQCCYGGNPDLKDMIQVQIANPEGVKLDTGLVSVAGVFHLKDFTKGGQLMPVYELEATYFSLAKTSF